MYGPLKNSLYIKHPKIDRYCETSNLLFDHIISQISAFYQIWQ